MNAPTLAQLPFTFQTAVPALRVGGGLATATSLTALLSWQEPLATRMRYRHNLPGRVANRLLNIELGLYMLAELLPDAPPEALPNLLNGQGFLYSGRAVWSPRQHRNLSRARVLLAPYRDHATWFNALTKYATLPDHLRTFSLTGNHQPDLTGYEGRERLTLFQKVLR